MIQNANIAAAVTAATLLAAVAAVTTLPPPAPPATAHLSPEDDCAVPTPTPRYTTSPLSAGVRLRSGGPARPVLLDLAGRLAAEPCDATAGRFAVVRYHLWQDDTSGTGESDVVRWYAADDSGAELAIRSPHQQVAHDWWQPGDLRARASNLTNVYASSAWLITQAQLNGWGDDPPALVNGLAALAMWHSPNRGQRQLTARVLADASGLTAHPATTDRAGRVGVGIAAFSERGRARHLLILDPHTAQVLAYEDATLTVSGWRAQVYLLLLSRTHTPRRWWEPPSASAVASPRRHLYPRHSATWLIHQDQLCITDRT